MCIFCNKKNHSNISRVLELEELLRKWDISTYVGLMSYVMGKKALYVTNSSNLWPNQPCPWVVDIVEVHQRSEVKLHSTTEHNIQLEKSQTWYFLGPGSWDKQQISICGPECKNSLPSRRVELEEGISVTGNREEEEKKR